MLVLLIIMMIVAPLLQQGVPVTLPLASNSTEKPETQDQTVVTIDRNKDVYLNAKAGAAGSAADAESRRSSKTSRTRSSSSRPTTKLRTARSWTRWTSCGRPASRTWA